MEIYLPPPGPVIHFLPKTYLSYTLDISYLLGGHWWGKEQRNCRGLGIQKVEPLELKDPKLIRWASYLSPAFLRIGGTEADRVYYRIKKKLPPPERTQVDYQLVLKKKQWKQIISFTRKVGANLIFTLNCGWADRTETGDWDSLNAQRLIAYTARKKLPVAGWELGNEVNGYLFIEGVRFRVSALQYVNDFLKLSQLVQELHPQARAIGPASAFWPFVGEPHPIIPSLASCQDLNDKDVISWHFYPLQSNRGRFALRRVSLKRSLSLTIFKEAEKFAKRIRKYLGNREFWLTEAGHALYGGEPGLSDTYVSTLWWLDLLGRMAKVGVSHVFRQTLVGSDYGLLYPDTLDPRPDYYASFLWKKLMGQGVCDLPPSPSKRVFWYCHTTEGKKKSFTYLIVNLNSQPITLYSPGPIKAQYILQAEGQVNSYNVLLNDTLVEPNLVTDWHKKKLKEIYNLRNKETSLVVPAYGCAFLVVRF
ncbi:MAG: glycoside hydrolase [Spirochaetales bacterium]